MTLSLNNLTFIIVTFKSEHIIYKCIESLPKNSNIIISAHNGVIRSTDIFDEIRTQRDFSLIAKKFMEEGGFIVMKNENNRLIFIDVFFTFHDFQLNFQKRPID